MIKYYENWKNGKGKEILDRWVIDPLCLLSKTNINIEGVYSIDILYRDSIIINMYVGQIGNINNDKSYIAKTVPDRILQHLKAWLGNHYVEYWTGVTEQELNDGIFKFHIQLLQEESDYQSRLALENYYILKRKPYLQYSSFKKWNTSYNKSDLAIIPFEGTRRKAFLSKLKELDLNYVSKTSWDKNWFSIRKRSKPSKNTIDLMAYYMPKGSELHKRVKKYFDEYFGFDDNSRGCTYNYLIDLFGKAYEFID